MLKTATLKSGATIDYDTVEKRLPTETNPLQVPTYLFYQNGIGVKAIIATDDVVELEKTDAV